MNDARGQAGGFTLLELLVATAMMAVLAGSLYMSLQAAFRARKSAEAAVGQMRHAELAVDLLRADLVAALAPKGILAGIFLGEDAVDAAGQPMDALTLHCAADGGSADTEGAGDIRKVELSCRPAEEGEGLDLVRRVYRFLLATRIEEPPEEVLCRNVRLFDLKYHDGVDWQDSWDSTTHDNALPLAVQVTLELVGEDGKASARRGYMATRVFQVPCAALPAEAATAATPSGG